MPIWGNVPRNAAHPRNRRGEPWDLGRYVRDRPLRWKELVDVVAKEGGVSPDRAKQLVRESTGKQVFKVALDTMGHAYADGPEQRPVLVGDKICYEYSGEHVRHLVEHVVPILIKSSRDLTEALHTFVREPKKKDHLGDLRTFLVGVEKSVTLGVGRRMREHVDHGVVMMRYLYPDELERKPEFAALRQHLGGSHALFVALRKLRQASTRVRPSTEWRLLESAVVSAVRELLLRRDFPGTCDYCPRIAGPIP